MKEKDLTLHVAQKLKATIEARLGLRVFLTRDGDDNVPYDRRTAIANNNKADVFFSLHVNASLRPDVRGAQVLSLSVGDYAGRAGPTAGRGAAVPALGGGATGRTEAVRGNAPAMTSARQPSCSLVTADLPCLSDLEARLAPEVAGPGEQTCRSPTLGAGALSDSLIAPDRRDFRLALP